jgi:hypothetical protein
MCEEEIAATFFVSVQVVKQRLSLPPSRQSCSTSMPRTACPWTSSWRSP